MKRSTDRILTTHVGSLPRPGPLLDRMSSGEHGDDLDRAVAEAVAEAVRQQVVHGVDVVTDGEQGKTGFLRLRRRAADRVRTAARRPAEPWRAEVSAFPEYYAEYFSRSMTGGSVVALEPLVCTGPVAYRGHAGDRPGDRGPARGAGAAARRGGVHARGGAERPGHPRRRRDPANEYYPSYPDYLFAVADALHEEYRAIVDAGFLLQVDDPFLTDVLGDAGARPQGQERAGGAVRRGGQPGAARHPAGPGQVPHLLRHQRGAARPRRGPGRRPAVGAPGPGRGPVVRGRQRRATSTSTTSGRRCSSRRPRAAAGRDHPREQHRRAPRADRRADHPLRPARGPRERHRERRLRLLVPGDLPARGRSPGDVGQVRRASRRRGARLRGSCGRDPRSWCSGQPKPAGRAPR